MWFPVASVVDHDMCHVVSCGQRGTRHVHLVSCGQRSARDASCVVLCGQPWYLSFMRFRVASVVLEMFHAVSCGQCGTRDVSCGFVWPAWYSRLFMWFRGASVLLEVSDVRGARVVLELLPAAGFARTFPGRG